MKSSQLKFAYPPLQKVDFEVKPRSRNDLLVGIGLLILVILVPFGTFILAGFIMKLVSSCISISLILFILAGAKISMTEIFRLSKRYTHNPLATLLLEERAPVLYLRSFRNQLEKAAERIDEKTPEELLALAVEQFGPMITVGQPKEKGLSYLGATRIYIDDDWEGKVKQLMLLSQLVLIDADTTKSVLWEIKTAKETIFPAKLIISFLSKQQIGNFESFYKKFARKFNEIFDCNLPSFHPDACFIHFTDDWKPHFVKLNRIKTQSKGGLLGLIAFSKFSETIFSQQDIKESLALIITKK